MIKKKEKYNLLPFITDYFEVSVKKITTHTCSHSHKNDQVTKATETW